MRAIYSLTCLSMHGGRAVQLSELMAGGVPLYFPLEGIDTQVEQCHLPGVCDSIFDLNSSHSLSFVVFI